MIKNAFKNKKLIIILIIIMLLVFVFYQYNIWITKQKLEKLSHNQHLVDSELFVSPEKKNIKKSPYDGKKVITKFITDENGKKLYQVTFEKIGNSNCLQYNYPSLLLENGNVLFRFNEIYDSKTKEFQILKFVNKTEFGNLSTQNYLLSNAIYNTKTNELLGLSNSILNKIEDFKKIKNQCIWYTETDPPILDFYKRICSDQTNVYIEDNYNFSISKPGKLIVYREGSVNAILLRNGKVLIIGGYYVKDKKITHKKHYNWGSGTNVDLKDIELYDPMTGKISLVGNMKVARSNPKSIELKDGRILITDGYNPHSNNISNNSAEIFDLKTGNSTLTQNSFLLPNDIKPKQLEIEPYKYYELALLKDGSVLCYGAFAKIYDPEKNMFYKIPDVPLRRIEANLTVLKDGKVLITGGNTYDQWDSFSFKMAELLNIKKINKPNN